MNDLFKAAPHISMHAGTTMVIKAGGGTLTRPHWLRQFAKQIGVVRALGARVVVVHGAGPQTDTIKECSARSPRWSMGAASPRRPRSARSASPLPS